MDQEKIGKLLKELRIKNGYSQKDLADKLNITYQAVSKWENGKNIPDIALLKEISELYNISLEDIINGNVINKSKKINVLYLIIPLLIILSGLVIYILTRDNNINLTKLEATCNTFSISGSAAYNKKNASINIYDIKYCGNKLLDTYSKLSCSLFEEVNDISTKISDCEEKSNLTIDEYLKDLELKIDNYTTICKNFKDTNLYLMIYVVDKNNEEVSHKIPIKMDSNCL